MPDMIEQVRGKTKIVRASESNPSQGEFEALDQVTWDNIHREPMPGKGIWSTTTAVNVFQLLQEAGIPVAYTKQIGERTFRGPRCTMIPLEVIVRGAIDENSSYLKRHPGRPPGERFEIPIVEFFLKTDTNYFNGIELPDVDPYIGRYADSGIVVYHPKKPLDDGVFLSSTVLGWDEAQMWPFGILEHIAREAFCVARKAWARIDFDLRDWKVEFGFDASGEILLADVIDNDSWRILGPDGKEYSKQNVRNGKNLVEAAKDYEYIASSSACMLAASRRPSNS
ncbi:MAG: phosphoribosylaminoimidazolesuccinocarboxamide synthase [bacterium]|nr:phosphoribosylaminoimidazolesuccinocarboxamide synthase [bacterium]